MQRPIEHILRSTAAALLLLAALAAASCVRDDELPEEGKFAGDVYVHFRMELNDSGIPGGTRAGETGTTPHTPREEAVSTVDLLVCDAATGCLFARIPLNAQQIGQVTGSGVVVPVTIPEGRTVHVYAAVNMTDLMRKSFRIGENCRDLALASIGTNYWGVIEDFVPGSAGQQETLEKNSGCIPMTGQFTVDATAGNEIALDKAHATEETALPVTAKVSRIVAKVHVLANTDDTGTYVQSTTSDGEQIGWIHLSDLRYQVNGTNKSTFLFAHPNNKAGEYGWRDPNMDLERCIAGVVDADLEFDASAWRQDYIFDNGLSLHKENIAATNRLARVERFDQTRYDHTANGSSAADRYTRGMYCLENYFDTPANDAAFAACDEAIPMVTHLSVAAKLTPQWIVLTADYAEKMEKFIKSCEKEEFLAEHGLTKADFTAEDVTRWKAIRERYSAYFTGTESLYREVFRLIRTENEADAADILNWSLKINNLWCRNPGDFENGRYPDGTFYVYDLKYDAQTAATNELAYKLKHLYLSAGAVAAATTGSAATTGNIDIKAYSVPHIGGWGYYYTYLDEFGAPHEGRTPYTASQVTRNTYYLITLEKFGVPGGSTSRPEYIRVNTEPVVWDYEGKGDIDLH